MSGDREILMSGTGQLVEGVHPAAECDPPCPIHNPTPHPLSEAPLHFRMDRRIWERICPHGVGHPDPDDQAFKARLGLADGTHGCDGCCSGRGPSPSTPSKEADRA